MPVLEVRYGVPIDPDLLVGKGYLVPTQMADGVILPYFMAVARAYALSGVPGTGSTVNGATDGVVVTAAARSAINAKFGLHISDNPGTGQIDIMLDGDVAVPGANKFWGTDGSGNRGYQPLPTPLTLRRVRANIIALQGA